MNTAILSITISVIALIVSILNATTGISNFILSRFRLLGVRQLECWGTQRGNPPKYTHRFVVDMVSYGAAIWDIEAQIEIMVPVTDGNIRRGFAGRFILGLKPVGKYINPLNAGQGMEFEMWADEMLEPHFRDQIYKFLPYVPYRNISLCIYCNQKRKLLRRIRHPFFHWKLDQFLDGKMKVKMPHYLIKYLDWKHRGVLKTQGKSENTQSRAWTPPWKRP